MRKNKRGISKGKHHKSGVAKKNSEKRVARRNVGEENIEKRSAKASDKQAVA